MVDKSFRTSNLRNTANAFSLAAGVKFQKCTYVKDTAKKSFTFLLCNKGDLLECK